jgi:hypothetical protein
MLEYCDNDARQAVIKMIYEEYKKEIKKSCMYGVPDFEVIKQWEDFRCNWLVQNIGNPLKEIKKNG